MKIKEVPVNTGRKLNVLCTFKLHPVPTGVSLTYTKQMRSSKGSKNRFSIKFQAVAMKFY